MTEQSPVWVFKRLDEIADVIRGVTYSAKDVVAEGTPDSLMLLRATNIQDGKLDNVDPVFIPSKLVKPHQFLLPGDIVMASSSGSIQIVGKNALVRERIAATFGAFCTVIRAREVDPTFLFYFLQSPVLRQQWSDLARGSNINNLKTTDTASTIVPVSPVDDQKRIVETLDGHLSKIDKAISDLDYADSQAQLFRRSILNTLLNFQLSGSEPGIESITRQLDWTTVPLSKLVDVLDNKRIPLSASQRKHREGSVPYYGATGQVGTVDEHLFDEPLVLLGEDGVQFFDANKPKAYKIEGPSWVNNHAHVLRPRAGLIEFGYLLHFLNNFDYRGYANGTTRLKLTQGAMNSIPIHLPPLKEQKRIVATIDDHLSRLDSTRKSIASQKYLLANLRRSILHSTFTAQSTKEN